jgi:hypothetical protein
MPERESDDVLDFTPETGFIIEKLAETIVRMMDDLGMDAQVNLPGNVVIEIDKDCSVQDIIAGYRDYMATHITARPVSNRNEKKTQ